MRKLTIKQLRYFFEEVDEKKQKRIVGGLSVTQLLQNVMNGDFDKYAGMTFNCDNGQITSMTATDGTTYYVGPETICIAQRR